MAKNKRNTKSSSRDRDSGSSRRRRRKGGGTPSASRGSASVSEHTPPVSPLALGLGAGGLLIAVLGFWMIAQGSIALAPVLLVLAYLVLFPLALVR